MGIHYDCKSTRGDKAMKKAKARIEQGELKNQALIQKRLIKKQCTILTNRLLSRI